MESLEFFSKHVDKSSLKEMEHSFAYLDSFVDDSETTPISDLKKRSDNNLTQIIESLIEVKALMKADVDRSKTLPKMSDNTNYLNDVWHLKMIKNMAYYLHINEELRNRHQTKSQKDDDA